MKILLATNNRSKEREISELFKPLKIEVISTSGMPYPEPEEYGKTFEENALIKAKYYAEKTGFPSLADDSGLQVKVLNGAPGVFSARYAKDENGKADFYHGMQKLELELNDKGIKTRDGADKNILAANFTCSLCLSIPDEVDIITTGKCFGHLQFPPKGEKGFGYDPIFVADGLNKTFAEVEYKEKSKFSHRQKAFDKLLKKMSELMSKIK